MSRSLTGTRPETTPTSRKASAHARPRAHTHIHVRARTRERERERERGGGGREGRRENFLTEKWRLGAHAGWAICPWAEREREY